MFIVQLVSSTSRVRKSSQVPKKAGNPSKSPYFSVRHQAPFVQRADNFIQRIKCIECVHDGHVGGPKQYNDFSLGNKFYFNAN